ncbi:MAG: 30S ribosomal protein S1 [Methylococcaceae bacterium TMED69]|nr:MAG: 30S ribosomal protein S1 [Methylococcaceae bacterium TMED69]|tara:strand:+ start:6899 stop:8584 length:1686 start_codon:yes stop_codon:yes gene_type:complete
MTESFAELFENSDIVSKMRPGTIMNGLVVDVRSDFVVVNAGLKSEGIIPIEQFKDEKGDLDVNIGDEVEVALDAVEDGYGETRLSREKAKRAKAWIELEKACETQETVTGIITDKVKGGFTVNVSSVRAFLPGSLVDVRPVKDMGYLEGKPLDFKVIKVDKKRNNAVVSRRAVVESDNSVERESVLNQMAEGAVMTGLVKNLTDYGAFVDLGGVDGLLHITDMAWKRVKHPSELVSVGDEIKVKVLKFDADTNRVSLGLKQMGEDPWVDVSLRFPEGSTLHGKVSNITDYGCFVEIEEGVEGLVHVSEMDWTNKNVHPSKVVHLGDEVDVKVLEIDQERRRISLGMKQCKANPWEDFSANHQKNDKASGIIKSITDFGIFVGLDGGIDGLIHLSDLSWDDTGEDAVRNYKKGDSIEAVVLAVDAARERISLGIKQLDQDPFTIFQENNNRGSLVSVKVTAVDAKQVLVEVVDGVEGVIKHTELSNDTNGEDAKNLVKVDDTLEALVIGFDRKKRVVLLSVKAKESEEQAAALEEYGSETQSNRATLGDLMKEQLDTKEDSD